MYRTDDNAWLDEPTLGPLEWIAPYADAGWAEAGVDRGTLTLRSPDTLARITYRAGALPVDDREQAGQDGRFTIGTAEPTGWYGRFSGGTPARILHAVSTAMLDSNPVPRYWDALAYYAKQTATITLVTQPAPSPLDVQRRAARLRSVTATPPSAVSAPPSSVVWTSATPAARRR
ncbi:DUF317 domain-containing protein [Kitasatospora sp. NPDC097605]|uniref:DUF317 domain-containing protein n=1 Tax=Kitasatospora sp. NPDC097605 TaxID=3157226 RepID=UPI0033329194